MSPDTAGRGQHPTPPATAAPWECGRCGERFADHEEAQRHADTCNRPTMRLEEDQPVFINPEPHIVAAITQTDTTITVANVRSVVSGDVLSVDGELLRVMRVHPDLTANGTFTLEVRRAVLGSVARRHEAEAELLTP